MSRAGLSRRTGKDVSKEKVAVKVIVITGASSGFGAITARKARRPVSGAQRAGSSTEWGVYCEGLRNPASAQGA
jgi:hypothetical protein